MANAASEWTTIESDPGVFTALINDMGVSGVQVEELYSLDDESFKALSPVYGLIFLFKWDAAAAANVEASSASLYHPTDPIPSDLYFPKQVITNSCATQAILSILLNIPNLNLGPVLSQFKEFTADFDPVMKGQCIESSDDIRKVHNSFARPEPFLMEKDDADKSSSGDAFHFIAYVPFFGKVYELDGLSNSAPRSLGLISTDDWTDVVKPLLQKRFEAYQTGSAEIRFNLLALVRNRTEVAREALDAGCDIAEKEKWENVIQEEKNKMKRYEVENKRRKHNYLPFIMTLLKLMAKKDILTRLIEEQRNNNTSNTTTTSGVLGDK